MRGEKKKAVTHAANNHHTTVTLDGGKEVKKILRDSVDKPRRKRATSVPLPQLPKRDSVKKEVVVKPVAPWKPLSAATTAKREALQQTMRRVEEIGSSCTRSASEAGSLRIARLRERVLARARESC